MDFETAERLFKTGVAVLVLVGFILGIVVSEIIFHILK